jgi:hypothetical protein
MIYQNVVQVEINDVTSNLLAVQVGPPQSESLHLTVSWIKLGALELGAFPRAERVSSAPGWEPTLSQSGYTRVISAMVMN